MTGHSQGAHCFRQRRTGGHDVINKDHHPLAARRHHRAGLDRPPLCSAQTDLVRHLGTSAQTAHGAHAAGSGGMPSERVAVVITAASLHRSIGWDRHQIDRRHRRRWHSLTQHVGQQLPQHSSKQQGLPILVSDDELRHWCAVVKPRPDRRKSCWQPLQVHLAWPHDKFTATCSTDSPTGRSASRATTPQQQISSTVNEIHTRTLP